MMESRPRRGQLNKNWLFRRKSRRMRRSRLPQGTTVLTGPLSLRVPFGLLIQHAEQVLTLLLVIVGMV